MTGRMGAGLLAGALMLLGACDANETQSALSGPEERTCGAFMSDAAVKQDFAHAWKAELGAADAFAPDAQTGEPPLNDEELDGVVGFFEMIALGYCQANTAGSAPFPDSQQDSFAPTSADTAITEFLDYLMATDTN